VSHRKPTLAVWKLASCDGCQLSLLDLEDEFLALADRIEIAHFPEASSALTGGPWDLVLIEGSVSTSADREVLADVRAHARRLVTIGACATAGGIQALRNFQDRDTFLALVHPPPRDALTLDRSTPVAAHVPVDFELPGCPVDKLQLLEVILAFLHGRAPQIAAESVCVECKFRGTACIAVASNVPCMGPVTQAGCGALCPAWGRGCYGCFGPKEHANIGALRGIWAAAGVAPRDAERALRGFTAWAPAFREAT
jgi:coenzyme F420-reducing hydrogenase gamma subunit